MKRMVLMILALGLSFSAQTARADWTPTKRLTWTSGYVQNPTIAVDRWGKIHLVWYDDTPGNSEIYYKNSPDRGATWTLSKRITWTEGDSIAPAIAIDYPGNLHVVWYANYAYTPNKDGIYYKKSTDGGATWTLSKLLFWTDGNSLAPAITIDTSGNLHLVWDDSYPGNYELLYKKSTDGGDTWTLSERLTWTSGDSRYPAIAAPSSENIYVFWSDGTPGNDEIYLRKSTDGGATWSASKRLTWNSGDSRFLALCYAYGNFSLVWEDDTPGNEEIYYMKSTDGAASWTTRKRLTWTSARSFVPAIAVPSSGNLHVVWYESQDFAIYYREGTDGGATWTPAKRLSWNLYAKEPAVVVDDLDTLHVVWSAYESGLANSDIYYRSWVE